MDTIKYTQITEETQKLEIEGGGEKIEVIEESVEVINVAAAEVRKIEAAAAAQARTRRYWLPLHSCRSHRKSA